MRIFKKKEEQVQEPEFQSREEFEAPLLETFVEVDVPSSDDFLKIKETLTRMGVANRAKKTLWQSCHILHKRGRYYIVHFKELFALDGKYSSMGDEDYARRNSIAKALENWGLLTILTPDNVASPVLAGKDALVIIPHREKKNWTLEAKYEIGKKK